MATPYQERKIADPELNPGDKEYFDAAAEGKLMLKKCGDCGEVHHYPRALCPFCFSDKVQWTPAKGTGVIYTYSVTRRGGPVPYCIAYVTLDEGVTLLTNLVECDFDALAIDRPVRLAWRDVGPDASLPVFKPA